MPSYRVGLRRNSAVRLTQAAARRQSELENTDYRQLQARAKELDIPANQSAAALTDAIAKAEADE